MASIYYGNRISSKLRPSFILVVKAYFQDLLWRQFFINSFCTFRSRSCLIEPLLKIFSMETMREKFPWTKLLMRPDGLIFIPSLHPFLRYYTSLAIFSVNSKVHIIYGCRYTIVITSIIHNKGIPNSSGRERHSIIGWSKTTGSDCKGVGTKPIDFVT